MCKYCSAAAVAMLLGAITVRAQLPPAAKGPSKLSVAGRFAIELTAPRAAHIFVQGVAGGQAVSEVVSEGVTPGGIGKKQVGGVAFTPITVRGNAAELLTAFQAALDKPAIAFDGSILTMNFDFKTLEEMSFTSARVTQIVLSALDASSKEATTLELTLAPEQVRVRRGGGPQFAPDRSEVEKGGSLGFHLQMPGLDDAMSHVMRVDAVRMMQGAAGKWQNGNIVLTIPLAHAEELIRWRQQLLAGRSTALDKTLDVHLFAGAKELLLLHASGVSLVSMREVNAPSSERVVQAELIVQHWEAGQASSTALR